MTLLREISKLKINPEAIISFTNGDFKLLIPSSHDEYQLNADILEVIFAFSGKNKLSTLRRLCALYNERSIRASVAQLVSHNILTPTKKKFIWSKEWRDWGVTAWAFHLDGRNAHYAITMQERQENARQVNSKRSPSIYKCSCNLNSEQMLRLPQSKLQGSVAQGTLCTYTIVRGFSFAKLRHKKRNIL